MRNLVASSIRRWRLPLAPNLASADGASEQVVATCYDAESRVTYAVTDACNMYGLRDSAREGDDAELCLEMCLVESVPSAPDAFDTPIADTASAPLQEPDEEENLGANDVVDGDERDVESSLESKSPKDSSSLPPREASDATTSAAVALCEPSPVVGFAFVDDLRGVCAAFGTGELLLVAPDPDDDAATAPGAVLTADMTPECVGKVAQGLRAMRWNPDGELLVLATWAGTLILMTKEFRVLAEAPVGGGGGDGVASLSWRGDGQFLASLVSARGAEPQLRVWERDDLAFHATGESLRPARISAGHPRGGEGEGEGGRERRESEKAKGASDDAASARVAASPPHAPPLAWQPRGALVAVACAPQRAREDESDTDSASASDAVDEEASRRRTRETLPPTEAEIVFFERNGLRRGSFALPARGAGAQVTSLAWSCDSERLAVCVANPEAFEAEKDFEKAESSGAAGKAFRARDVCAATQIWRRGNGKWYLSREIVFPAREGDRAHCAWDLTDPRVLRVATPAGRVEEHAFADEQICSSAATTATIDGADVLVTPLARALFPPPMCAATVAFPATVADVCFSPASAIRLRADPARGDEANPSSTDDGDSVPSAARASGFVPRGEAVLALLSDGRLAVASARRATEWEETVESIADADDELQYGKADAHLDADAAVKMEARLVEPVGGTFSVLERFDDAPRRVAWLDAETALVAADRPSDGSACLLTVRLSYAWDDASDESFDESFSRREPRWSAEVVSVVDLPSSAIAIARAEGESPAGAFVQTQERSSGDESSSASENASSAPVLFASVVADEHGDPTLSAIPASWPSASLPRACVALAALPPAARGAPPGLAGLDARGVLFCGARVVARDVRSFAVHFGDESSGSRDGGAETDAALASASAYAERWRAWSAGAETGALADSFVTPHETPRPEARLVCATLADELRVVELAELVGEADDDSCETENDARGLVPALSRDGVGAAAEKNAFAAAAGGTRVRTSAGAQTGPGSIQNASGSIQNDRMHVSMRAAMRPADAGRAVDSRTRRVEQGARVVAAIPGGVDVVLQMPRGNLETVAPRFLVLPAVARALDERRFAAAAALAARHRVDLNLIVDRAWPRFLRHADAFVRDVDDPDVVAELLECLDGGDCTAPGAPYAHLAAPEPERAEPSEGLTRDARRGPARAPSTEEETSYPRETPTRLPTYDREERSGGLLTRPSLDLVGVALGMLSQAEASSRDAGDDAGASPRDDDEDEAAAKARRLSRDPRGKIRLTCSAVARAVARVAAEKDAVKAHASRRRRGGGNGADAHGPSRGPAARAAGSAYSVVEPAEEIGDSRAVDDAKSPPVAVSVARFESLSVASVAREADEGTLAESGLESARDGDEDGARARASPHGDDASPSLSLVDGRAAAAEAEAEAEAEAADPGTIDHASLRVDVDALLPDRWELVMLSAHARSSPPDLEGALGRVRRRRESEIARSARRANAVSVETENDKAPARASAASPRGSSAAAADGPTARLASTIDRFRDFVNEDDDVSVDSEAALDHLLALEGGKPLFDAAMGTYDLSAAYLVGQRAPGMDPGEYVPELERLQAMPEPLRKADVDLKLGRWRSAVENLLLGGDATRACALAAKRNLFPVAMAAAAEAERADDENEAVTGGTAPKKGSAKKVSALRETVAAAYAEKLCEERRHEDAAVVLLSAGRARGAMRAYADAGAWRPALALAGRLKLPADERLALASELADALEPFDPAAAAQVAERELGDVDRAASLLCAARNWRDALAVAYARGRGDLVETTVAPAAAEAASGLVATAREAPARAEKYLERLRALRRRREALQKALNASGADGAFENGVGPRGRPGTRRDADDDALRDDGASVWSASAASVSTLASGVSGFSAYTDRTLGAATATTATGTSLSASTVGGRKAKKPTRAERRGKRAGAGLRAGGPTEERDLANHLASGGVAGDLLAVGALERVGELSELLVVLGHADDAAKLQSAVAAAVEAHERAGAEARRALDALDAADGDGADADAVGGDGGARARVDGKKEKKKTPCACAACVAHRSAHCLAAKNAQWKWAALRDATLPQKKMPTVWDDVAETAREATRETR